MSINGDNISANQFMAGDWEPMTLNWRPGRLAKSTSGLTRHAKTRRRPSIGMRAFEMASVTHSWPRRHHHRPDISGENHRQPSRGSGASRASEMHFAPEPCRPPASAAAAPAGAPAATPSFAEKAKKPSRNRLCAIARNHIVARRPPWHRPR